MDPSLPKKLILSLEGELKTENFHCFCPFVLEWRHSKDIDNSVRVVRANTKRNSAVARDTREWLYFMIITNTEHRERGVIPFPCFWDM